jgi:hypothetical protein
VNIRSWEALIGRLYSIDLGVGMSESSISGPPWLAFAGPTRRKQKRSAFIDSPLGSWLVNDRYLALSLDFCNSTTAQPVTTLCAMPRRRRQRQATSVSPFSFVPRCVHPRPPTASSSAAGSPALKAPVQETGRVFALERCGGAGESQTRRGSFHGLHSPRAVAGARDEGSTRWAIDRFCKTIW